MRKVASGYRLILGYLGLFIIFVGIACLLPLLALIAYPSEAGDWSYFVIPGVSAIILGIGLFSMIWKRDKAQLGKHQDSVLLVLVWVNSILISAVPFILKGDMGFTDSIFETTSAYGTIGLTVLPTSYYDANHVFVLYRSLLSFIGGIGLVLIITSTISDRYGLKLYIAEGHNDKLMPNLAKSARLILSIYFGIICLGTLLFWVSGMPVFDAIIHSISAVATAGFSSRPEGIMFFADKSTFWAIQIVAAVLMILGSINFLLHMFIITGKFKKVFRDCEVRLFGILALIFIPLFFVAVLGCNGWKDPGHALTTGTFTYISAITTTGFSNTSNLVGLGQGLMFLVVIINIIGGGMGSTAGGVKQYRLAVSAKSFYWSTKEKLSSTNYIYPHYVWRCGEQKEIKANDTAEAFGYILIYVSLMLLGGLLITIFDDFTYGEALFEFSNALSSTGLSNGVTALGNAATKWILIVGMFAGRLEILVIAFAIFRLVRDIFRKETK